MIAAWHAGVKGGAGATPQTPPPPRIVYPIGYRARGRSYCSLAKRVSASVKNRSAASAAVMVAYWTCW